MIALSGYIRYSEWTNNLLENAMNILLYDFLDGGYSEMDVSEFISRCGINRLIDNLANKWDWDLTGQYGLESDGPCVFVSFSGDK